MVRLFADEPSDATRALQIWQILICAASQRQTLTYKILANRLGFKGASPLGRMLGQIMFYCRQQGLPPLTVIVVNQETGLPGEGLTETQLNADREAVFRYDWFGIFPPTPDEFRAANRAGQELQAEEIAGKYVSLHQYLAALDPSNAEETLLFSRIEEILGFALPASARDHREWWANPSSSRNHPHAQSWLRAGWRVETVNLNDGWVRFRRR